MVVFSFSLTVRTFHGLLISTYNFARSLEVRTRTPKNARERRIVQTVPPSTWLKVHRIKKKGRAFTPGPSWSPVSFLSSGSAALPGYGKLMAGAVWPSKVKVYE